MSIKFFTALVFSFFGATYTHAQIQYFKNYGLPNQNEWLIGIEPAAEPGQFWAAGLTRSVGQDDFLILKMDSIGQILWADTIGSPLHNELIFGFDRDKTTGTMWISGSRTAFGESMHTPLLIKLDANGNYVLEKTDPSSQNQNYGFHSPVALPGGGVIAYVTSKSGLTTSPVLRRFDAAGTQQMVTQYFNGNLNLPEQSLAVLPDLHFFTIRPFGQPFSNDLRAELSFNSPSGAVIWSKDIQSPSGAGKTRAQNIIFDPSDTSVIVAHFESATKRFLTKIDVAGNIKWQVETNDWYSSSFNYPRLVLDGHGAVGLLFEKIFELRDVENGAFLAANDFSGTSHDWKYTLADAAFLPSGKVAAVGKSDFQAELDGCFVLLNAGDFEILEEKAIGTSGLPDADSSPFVEAADGHIFVMSGADFGISKSRELVLRKIDPASGAEVWVKNYGTILGELPKDILRLSDGNLLLVARQSSNLPASDSVYLAKINPADGAVFWEKLFASPSNYYGINGAATPDGGAVVVYTATVPDPANPNWSIAFQLQGLRVDAAGQLVWWHWFEPTWSQVLTTGQRGIEQVLALADGNFLAVGMENERSGLALKIDASDGDVAVFSLLEPVELNDDRQLVSTVQFQNGDIALLSRNYRFEDSLILYRLAPNGDVLLRKTMKVANSHYGSTLHIGNDGGLLMVLSFNNDFGAPAGLQVLRLDADFNVLSTMVLFDKERRPADARLLSDGAFALVGVHTPTNTQDIYLIKTLSIPTVSSIDFSEKLDFQISPNPISENQPLQILLENEFLGKVNIEVLSLEGRVISVFEKEKAARRQVFEMENLPEGNSFFVRVLDGKGSATRLVLKF